MHAQCMSDARLYKRKCARERERERVERVLHICAHDHRLLASGEEKRERGRERGREGNENTNKREQASNKMRRR